VNVGAVVGMICTGTGPFLWLFCGASRLPKAMQKRPAIHLIARFNQPDLIFQWIFDKKRPF